MTGCGFMSSVLGMIHVLQSASTLKVTIELPVATRHRRNMTEKLLKAMLKRTSTQTVSLMIPGKNDFLKLCFQI